MSEKPLYRPPTAAEFAAAAKMVMNEAYQRLPSERNCEDSISELHLRLVESARLYEEGGLQDKRDAVSASLIAVQQCLTSVGFGLATIAPIIRSVEALIERENNARDPLFCERPRVGRPKGSFRIDQRSGVLAALADTWLEIHVDSDLRQTAELARLSRILIGPWFGKITVAKLQAARALISQEAKDHIAVQQYRMIRSDIAVTAGQFGQSSALTIMVNFLNAAPSIYNVGDNKISETRGVSPIEAG